MADIETYLAELNSAREHVKELIELGFITMPEDNELTEIKKQLLKAEYAFNIKHDTYDDEDTNKILDAFKFCMDVNKG